jgi:tetratricopeptide (TPR) repeat protein
VADGIFQKELDRGLQSLANGENEIALKHLEAANQLKPRTPDVLCGLGLLFLRAGVLDQATHAFDDVLRLDSTHRDALLYRGIVEMQHQHWAKAIAYFEKLTLQYPLSYQGFHQAGICLGQLKDFAKGIQSLKKSLELYPASADAQMDLAVITFYSGSTVQALETIRETVKQNPRNERAQHILAEISKVASR